MMGDEVTFTRYCTGAAYMCEVCGCLVMSDLFDEHIRFHKLIYQYLLSEEKNDE